MSETVHDSRETKIRPVGATISLQTITQTDGDDVRGEVVKFGIL